MHCRIGYKNKYDCHESQLNDSAGICAWLMIWMKCHCSLFLGNRWHSILRCPGRAPVHHAIREQRWRMWYVTINGTGRHAWHIRYITPLVTSRGARAARTPSDAQSIHDAHPRSGRFTQHPSYDTVAAAAAAGHRLLSAADVRLVQMSLHCTLPMCPPPSVRSSIRFVPVAQQTYSCLPSCREALQLSRHRHRIWVAALSVPLWRSYESDAKYSNIISIIVRLISSKVDTSEKKRQVWTLLTFHYFETKIDVSNRHLRRLAAKMKPCCKSNPVTTLHARAVSWELALF
jgi:hypothetical protein